MTGAGGDAVPGSVGKFVIVAAPRTGSNMLCTLLNSHPDILCHHELFNPRGIFLALDHRDGSLDLGTLAARDRDPDGFLERVWRTPLGACCVGFKMTRGQAWDVLRDVVRDREVATIVLRRANRLKTFVSTLVAERTDRWEAYRHEPPEPDVPRVRVEVAALQEHVRVNEGFYRDVIEALETSGQRYLSLCYEDLDDRAAHERALDFLGLPAPHPSLVAQSVKQNPSDLRTVIANFDELDAALGGTGHHAELHDTGN